MQQKDAIYNGLEIIIDTRERRKERIEHIKEWVFARGGSVKMGTIKKGDYYVSGTFNKRCVDLIIEYKERDDFCSSFKELHTRFSEMGKEYNKMALFIEGKIDIVGNEETGKYFIKNSIGDVGPTDNKVSMAECCSIYTYHHNVHEFERLGVIVEQFNFLFQFGPYLDALLYYITNYPFAGIHLPPEDGRKEYYSMYAQIPGIATSAEKICHGSPGYWLANPEELYKIMGKSKGDRVFNSLKPKLVNRICSDSGKGKQ